MIAQFKHVLKVAHALVREHIIKASTRSAEWPKTRKLFLKSNPKCACCGSTALLQVHHLVPFHLHHELELDPKNLITLCMSKNECHLLVGHGDNFKKYNPYVAADVKNVASGIISLQEAQKLAKKNAIF